MEARGTYKKANKFCPILSTKSNIECVVGLDRLDCLRRIHKGTAHFGVFSSEDLIAAEWADVDVLITSEMRFNDSLCSHFVYFLFDHKSIATAISCPYIDVCSLIFFVFCFLFAGPFEYEVVAIVANDAGINSVNDLRDSRFCHPGHGLTSHWTDVLANVSVTLMMLRCTHDAVGHTQK